MINKNKYINWQKVLKIFTIIFIFASIFFLSFLISFNIIGKNTVPKLSRYDGELKSENTDLKEKVVRLQDQLDEARAELDRLRALPSYVAPIPSNSNLKSNVFPPTNSTVSPSPVVSIPPIIVEEPDVDTGTDETITTPSPENPNTESPSTSPESEPTSE